MLGAFLGVMVGLDPTISETRGFVSRDSWAGASRHPGMTVRHTRFRPQG